MFSMAPTLARGRCSSVAASLQRTQARPETCDDWPVGRAADLYARVSPRLAHRPGTTLPTRAHAWLFKRSKGRLGRRFFGAPVLVLRTTGRRSGEQRESPMFFVRHGEAWAVVASNAASERPPAWFLNLTADPEVHVLEGGGEHAATARQATQAEAAELWPRFVEVYRGYEHYREIATHELPVVILEPRA
jgi:deazaflavin-dependent oxidoreductase (nitroreductase family)